MEVDDNKDKPNVACLMTLCDDVERIEIDKIEIIIPYRGTGLTVKTKDGYYYTCDVIEFDHK